MKKAILFLVSILCFSCFVPTDIYPPFIPFKLDAPELNNNSGPYSGPLNLSVTTDYSALLNDDSDLVQFKYTVDGSNPKTSSTAVSTTGSFTLSTSATLKIFAYIDSGMITDSNIKEYVYTIQ